MKKLFITLLIIAFGNASLFAFAPVKPLSMQCASKSECSKQHSSVEPEVSQAAANPTFNSLKAPFNNLMVPLARGSNKVTVSPEKIAFMHRPQLSPIQQSARMAAVIPKPQVPPKKKSFFSSTLFWAGVAVLAGGTAYFLLTGGDDEKTSTVGINITFPQ